MEKIKNINRYVHYYFLVVISSLLIWGFFEYISICNGQSCTFDMPKLWRGTVFIALILQLLSIIMIPFIRQYIKDSLKVLKEIYQKINESNFKKPFLIIRLSIAFIVICLIILFIYYVKLHGIAESEKSIAATQANMFVVAATLFTPIAALIFVQDWKEQHNKALISNEAKELWKRLIEVEKQSKQLDVIYSQSGQIQESVFFKSVANLDKSTSNLANEFENSALEVEYFLELAQDKASKIHLNYEALIYSYQTFLKDIQINTTIKDMYEDENGLRTQLIEENQNIRKYLSSYILIK